MKRFLAFIKKISPFMLLIYFILLVLILVFKITQPEMFIGIIHRLATGEKVTFAEEHNIIPFKVIGEYIQNAQAINDWFVKNLVGNILIFIPVGFLASLVLKKNKVWHVIIVGIVISLIIEILQAIFAVGRADIDDIILNTIGLLIGFGIYKLIYSVALKNSLD